MATMIKTAKRVIAFTVVMLMIVSTFDALIPTERKVVCAMDTDSEPRYMAKLKGSHVDSNSIMHTYVNVYQSIPLSAGKTYTYRCQYYDSTTSGSARIYLSSNTSECLEDADSHGRIKAQTKTEGVLELNYTANENDTVLVISMECDPEAVCYFWNISLTADDNPERNLLTNPDFQMGDGSWIGWTIKGTQVSSKTESDAIAETYGYEIVEYDKNFLDSLKETVGKDYQNPNVNFKMQDVNQYKELDLSNVSYMAKLEGTYTGTDGETKEWIWVSQGVTPQKGITYHLTYDYYVEAGDGAGVLWSDSIPYNSEEMTYRMRDEGYGTASISYTAKEEDTWICIRFECSPESVCYIKNVRLTEETSDYNLLRNGDFSESGGSWVGWTIDGTYINDKNASDLASASYGREVLSCDAKLFDNDIASWSVRPEIKESLEFSYRTKIQTKVTEESTPYMDFRIYDGAVLENEERVYGEQESDGRYRFPIEILPQQMEYKIVGTLHVDAADCEQQQSKSFSVKEYCIAMLKDSSSSRELKNLLADMVRYGGEAQKQLRVTDTIDKHLETVIHDYGNDKILDDICDDVKQLLSDKQTDESYSWKSACLILREKVTIRLKFAAEDISGLVVTANDTVYQIRKIGEQLYYVDIPVVAVDYGKAVTARFFKDNHQVGKELTYSVHTYLVRMKNHDAQKTLLQAIYRYGQSAVCYAEYLSENEETTELKQMDTYLYTNQGNMAERMNVQSGGADMESEEMCKSIMNASDNLTLSDGVVYYISGRSGNDANTGTSKESAWRTIDGYRTHIAQIKAGDTILFERDCVYRGEISENTVFPLVSGVSYGAYGIGAKPAIYGSVQNYVGLGAWKKTGTEHIWECNANIISDVGCIVFNHGQAVGVKRLESLDELTDNFEFYHEHATGKVYLYMESNPGLTFYDIEICENSYMVLGQENSHDIHIDNLSLKYSGGHAIRFHSGARRIEITNCEIGYIGGSFQSTDSDLRYGNGIEFWNGCSNIEVKKNWIYQIYDAGFTHQGGADAKDGYYIQENIVFADNLVEYCSFSVEYWSGNPDKDVLRNITYENNIIRFNGYGWGVIRPGINGVASVNAWGHTETFQAENFVIKNNIFDLSAKALIFSHYEKEPNVIFSGNSYYQKEGYVALWEGKEYLAATDQSTMENSVRKFDEKPNIVQFIGRKEKAE